MSLLEGFFEGSPHSSIWFRQHPNVLEMHQTEFISSATRPCFSDFQFISQHRHMAFKSSPRLDLHPKLSQNVFCLFIEFIEFSSGLFCVRQQLPSISVLHAVESISQCVSDRAFVLPSCTCLENRKSLKPANQRWTRTRLCAHVKRMDILPSTTAGPPAGE